MAKSLKYIQSMAYALINADRADSRYPLPLMNEFINNTLYDIAMGSMVDPDNKQNGINKGNVTFLEKQVWYSSAPAQMISVLKGSTTIVLNNALTWEMQSATGYGWIGGDIFSYTGKVDNPDGTTTLTGIPATGEYSIQHDSMQFELVKPLYELPDDYMLLDKVYYGAGKFEFVDYRKLYEIYRRYGYMGQQWYSMSTATRGLVGYTPPCTLYKARFLLCFEPEVQQASIQVMYQKRPTRLVQETDVTEFPDEYIEGVALEAGARMLNNRGEQDKAIAVHRQAFAKIKAMTDQENRRTSEQNFDRAINTSYDRIMYI